jgi:drug/metabolite transporter (DMT)-like permease
VSQSKINAAIASSLLLTVFLWGGNNAGTKWLVISWPPVWTASLRLLCAGPLLLAVLRFTNWLGEWRALTPELTRQLWLRGGFSLAIYMVAFNWALHFTAASRVALCLGASPVWALLCEERPSRTWTSARRYGAALLAVTGVLVLFWPALQAANLQGRTGQLMLFGDVLGLVSSILWASFSRQMRILCANMSGTEVAAHTMWMAGVWLLPVALAEIAVKGFTANLPQIGVQAFCIVFGAVVPYAIWSSALRHWRTSQVMLFNNLIPLSTMSWAYFFLGEPITHTFWMAMVLIIAGVVLGHGDWIKFFGLPESF